MHRLILLALLALGACTPGMVGFRRADAPMKSVVAFDPARFSGLWHEVAAIGRKPGARWSVETGPGGTIFVTTSRDGAGRGRMDGPGRIALSSFAAPLWVLWADADMRTLVLGTPDGSFAILLDRAARIPADRLHAAREILAWNGYDPEALD